MKRLGAFAPLAGLLLFAPVRVSTQNGPPLEFDVVSIKPNTQAPQRPRPGVMTPLNLPGGTFTMTNRPLLFLLQIMGPVRGIFETNVVCPDWVRFERYDVTAKPPAGSTPDQLKAMWQSFFADRLKLVAHVEQREVPTFALVMARSDGRLGPGLKKSTLDCTAPFTPPPPGQPLDFSHTCGQMGFVAGSLVAGGMTMDSFAGNLRVYAGRPVVNRTGLEGHYAVTLTFAPQNLGSAPTGPGDKPDFITALQEQLGLKLQSEKGTDAYLVIDHIERPTPN